MSTKTKPSALLPICAAAVSIFGSVLATGPAQADGGCVPNDAAGQVPRKANDTDMVCVSPAIAALVQQENANKDAGYAGGGAYGPLTCINGLVWREAYDGDGICVTPARRTETWQENANAGVGATGGLKPQTQPAGGGGGGNAPVGGDQGGAVLGLVNAQRAANGCGPLASNPQLTAAAARHANDMLKSGVEGHTGSDGSTDKQRIDAAGYSGATKWGEIVYWGTGSGGTPEAAVTWWMNSPGHRAIITDCSFTDVGFSAVSDGNKMTSAGDFGKK
jgi:uncharacterized protein YkwD